MPFMTMNNASAGDVPADDVAPIIMGWGLSVISSVAKL